MIPVPRYTQLLIRILAVVMSLWQIYTAVLGGYDPLMLRYIHLTFGLVLVFLIYRLNINRISRKWTLAFDYCLVILAMVAMSYLLLNFDYVSRRIAFITPISSLEKVMGVALVVLVLEGSRRLTGWILPILAIVSLSYPFVGPYLPGMLRHGGYSFERVIDVVFLSTNGIFGLALGVSAAYVMKYIIFGAFLTQSGMGRFIIDFSRAYVGSFRGGPAKVSIVGSGFMGMLSGTAVGNVATTGSVTIPMMKETGFKPHYAAAVESIASSGGIIMPPVMGSIAFVMSQVTSISYGKIILYATIPAVLYYASLFFMIHFRAVKVGLKGLPKDQLPNGREVLIRSWNLVIPVIVLVYFLVRQYTAIMAVMYALFSLVVVVQLRPATRMGWRQILRALEDGARGSLVVIMAVAVAGIIIGMLSLTGLATRFTGSLIEMSGGSEVGLLVLAALAAIFMGMGLPSVVSYLILTAMVVPSLVESGVPVVAAHLFIIYFSITAFFTPPFCTAVFAASGIAGSPIMKTAFTAMRIGVAAYILPFMFVYGNELLGIGTPIGIAVAFLGASMGILLLAAGVEGYLRTRMSWYERIMAVVGALVMINPSILTDILGVLLFGMVLLVQSAKMKNSAVVDS